MNRSTLVIVGVAVLGLGAVVWYRGKRAIAVQDPAHAEARTAIGDVLAVGIKTLTRPGRTVTATPIDESAPEKPARVAAADYTDAAIGGRNLDLPDRFEDFATMGLYPYS